MKRAWAYKLVPAALCAALSFLYPATAGASALLSEDTAAASALLSEHIVAAASIQLPDGTVAGLPEKLAILDSDGNSASSDTGEYFFCVENMEPYTAYSKDIQIMNLREDKAYHIYFYAYPLEQSGDIDLEEDCTAVFTLDGEQVFMGNVSGESADGSRNLSEEPLDLGIFEPGDSAVMNCTITWDGSDVDLLADYGSRVVDSDGEHIIREGNGTVYVEGEVTFRWVFYAAVDEEYTPPKTGLAGLDTWIYLAAIGVLIVLILGMLALLLRKKRRARRP